MKSNGSGCSSLSSTTLLRSKAMIRWLMILFVIGMIGMMIELNDFEFVSYNNGDEKNLTITTSNNDKVLDAKQNVPLVSPPSLSSSPAMSPGATPLEPSLKDFVDPDTFVPTSVAQHQSTTSPSQRPSSLITTSSASAPSTIQPESAPSPLTDHYHHNNNNSKDKSSAAPSTGARHYVGRLYECGWYPYRHSSLFQLWFPLHERTTNVFVTVNGTNNSTNASSTIFSPNDILIASGNLHFPSCQRNNPFFQDQADYHHWLEHEFPGKVLMFNEESFEDWRGRPWDRFYRMGGIYQDRKRARTMQVSFLQKEFVMMGPDVWKTILDASVLVSDNEVGTKRIRKRPKSTKERFLIYSNNHCVKFRDEAFLRLATEVATVLSSSGNTSRHTAAEYTHCDGTHKSSYRHQGDTQKQTKKPKRQKDKQGEDNDDVQQDPLVELRSRAHAVLAPPEVLDARWEQNVQVWSRYRFCLCMENRGDVFGYITEKILNAFLAGCIPIYYGSEHIFDIFHPQAFVYYNVTNETAIGQAIHQIRALEQNATLYDAMLAEPILKDGIHTLEKYFSLAVTIGNATLMKRMHEWMDLPLVNVEAAQRFFSVKDLQ